MQLELRLGARDLRRPGLVREVGDETACFASFVPPHVIKACESSVGWIRRDRAPPFPTHFPAPPPCAVSRVWAPVERVFWYITGAVLCIKPAFLRASGCLLALQARWILRRLARTWGPLVGLWRFGTLAAMVLLLRELRCDLRGTRVLVLTRVGG